MLVLKIPLLGLDIACLLAATETAPSPAPGYSRRRSERFLLAALPILDTITIFGFTLETLIIILTSLRLRHLASFLMLRGTPESLHTNPHFFIGTMIMCMAAIMRYSCIQCIRPFPSPNANSNSSATPKTSDSTLVFRGPYKIVRHPLYSSRLIAELGLFLIFSAKGTWIAESGVLDTGLGQLGVVLWLVVCASKDTILLRRRIPREEGMLKRAFGKEWVEYRKKVMWKLVPGVY
ncbi:hypothetical protein Moror_4392 [Moniliophthora roreri MCA 2997]|uniref:Protein-S-isoprenylcysteine O-methyltransferase n=1 Tax=Moniliophthora roreri (strain MCA 2997) TaxID=1381753 RepID=V2X0E2_MONRO|nr:hypothetical protein Moror_4392 [Moniliophthora roreri MCA 2997]